MATPSLDTTGRSDFDLKENALLSIELLARERRASTLASAERRNRRALLTAGSRPAHRGVARRVIGTYLVNLGTATAGRSHFRRTTSTSPIDSGSRST